jgi:hypothetical protein
MLRGMSSSEAGKSIRPEHAALVRELADLPESERRAIPRAAAEQARGRERPTLAALRSTVGVVKGAACDAMNDERALYDG